MFLQSEVRASAGEVIARSAHKLTAEPSMMVPRERNLVLDTASSARKIPWYLPFMRERQPTLSRGFVLIAAAPLVVAGLALYLPVLAQFASGLGTSVIESAGPVEVIAIFVSVVATFAAVMSIISLRLVLLRPDAVATSSTTDTVTVTGLALDFEGVFSRARERIEFAYRLRIGVAIALGLVFIVGLGGVVGGVALGTIPLAVASAGALTLALLGNWLIRPAEQLEEAIRDTAELDAIRAVSRDHLKRTGQIADLQERIESMRELWAALTQHWILRSNVGFDAAPFGRWATADYHPNVMRSEVTRQAKIAGAYLLWAERHPRRGKPFVLLASGRSLTPEGLAEEVAKGTPIGQSQIEAVEMLAERAGLGGALDILVSSVDFPALPNMGEPGGPEILPFSSNSADPR